MKPQRDAHVRNCLRTQFNAFSEESESDAREVVRQYWTIAGSPEWLAVQYGYTRKAATP